MPTDREILKKAQMGYVGSSGGVDPNASVGRAHERTYTYRQINATAGTAITESTIAAVRNRGAVRLVTVTAPIAVAAHASNGHTFNVYKRTAGASQTLIATGSTLTAGLNGLAAHTPATLTLTAANVQLAAGDTLTFESVVGGTGQSLTAAASQICCDVVVEEN
jgi:hypothetical protein